MERPLRIGEATVHRRGEETARSAHEGTPGLQVQAAEEDEDTRQETREVPARRRRAARRHRCVARRAQRRPAAATGRLPDDAQRIHAQRVHDARPVRLPAASLRVPSLRRGADAAKLRRRLLQWRARVAVHAPAAVAVDVRARPRLPRRLRAASLVRVALSLRLVGQVGARVARPARHEARVRALRADEARVPAARADGDEARVRAARPEPYHQYVPRAR